MNLIVLALLRQPTDAAADFTALTARLEKAALNDDAPGVKDARIACLRLLAAAPSGPKAAIVRYTIAYAGWRLAFSPRLQAAEQDGMLADAEQQLQQALKADGAFAEAYGLLASVYGVQIAKNAELGMTLGPAAGEMLGRAMSIDGGNPRLLMCGTTLLHTPAEIRGDPARPSSARRSRRSRRNPPEAVAELGTLDTHVWLGLALAGRGDTAGRARNTSGARARADSLA